MNRAALLLISFFIFTNFLSSQNPIIFRPGPGANDGNDEGTLSAGKDAWVYEGESTTNFGTTPSIQALPISNCNNTHCAAFIRFDLYSLPLDVDSVFLTFNHNPHTTYCYSGCDADFYFAALTQPWDETTINYTNIPAKDIAFYGPINITFPNDFGERQYDITNMYSLWKSGTVPNYGMTIYSSTVACNNAAVFFSVSSSDDTSATKKPFLKIYSLNTGIKDAISGIPECKLFPSPATDHADLQFTLKNSQNVKFQLIDLTGRVLYTRDYKLSGGAQKLNVPLNNIGPGMLMYNLSTADWAVSGKFVKM